MPTDEQVMQNAKLFVRRCFELEGFERATEESRKSLVQSIYILGIKLRDASHSNAQVAALYAEKRREA